MNVHEAIGNTMLSPITLIGILLGITVLQFTYQAIYYNFFHPLRKFPGPFWASTTRLWLAYQHWANTELEVEERLHKKYGSVLRVTPNMLLVSDSRKLPDMYHRTANKSDYYVTPGFGRIENVITTQGHKEHAAIRKVMAGPYSFSSIKKMESIVDARLRQWLERLEDVFVISKKPVPITDWTVYFTYDVVSEIGFGAPLGFITAGNDRLKIVPNLHQGLREKAILNRLHPFTKFIRRTPFRRLFESSPGSPGLGMIMHIRDKLIDQRLRDLEDGKAVRRDLLQNFLESKDVNGQSLSIPYIKAETVLVLTAGADTTATVMQGLIHQCITRPDIYERLQNEIRDAESNGFLSDIPQYEEVVEHMPFYIACLREVMRLWPSSPAIFPRLVDKAGIDFGGVVAPAGVEVCATPYLIHRDEALYGADASVFNPDRWLDAEKAKEYEKYNFAWGYGARVCLGKHVALMEMYKAPLQLLRTYNISKVNEQQVGTYTVIGGVAYWKDMWVNLSRR